MAHRAFTDREGRGWEVRVRSTSEWEFSPLRDNPRPAVSVRPPGYEKDPYEMSVAELQRLLDSAPATPRRERKSPFKD
jgi:hypothetical protein